MGRFDTTARRTAKREPAGFFRWVLPCGSTPALAFVRLARRPATAPSPPETELICDALAEFAFADRPEEPWIVVTEFQTEPRTQTTWRVPCSKYMLRFRPRTPAAAGTCA